MFLNFDYEKPSVSLTILMFLHTLLVLPNRRFGVERVATGILFCGFNPASLSFSLGYLFLERNQPPAQVLELARCIGESIT
jgi:hypothetical protein